MNEYELTINGDTIILNADSYDDALQQAEEIAGEWGDYVDYNVEPV